MKQEAFVYLLRLVGMPGFKIGKAVDIHQRIPQIGGHEAFDLNRSLCATFPSETLAKRYEVTMHEIFKAWNIPPAPTNRVPGDTEYFKIECFDEVVSFLKQNASFFLGKVGPIPPQPEVQQVRKTPVALTAAEKSLRRESRRNQARLDDEIINFKSTQKWDSFIEWFKMHQDLITGETQSGRDALVITYAMKESHFKGSGATLTGPCHFRHHEGADFYGFSYGALSFGGVREESNSHIYLAPLSCEYMKYVRSFSCPELILKIEAINDWIMARREMAKITNETDR